MSDTERNTINGYKVIRTAGKGGTSVLKVVTNDKGHEFVMKIFEPINEAERQNITA